MGVETLNRQFSSTRLFYFVTVSEYLDLFNFSIILKRKQIFYLTLIIFFLVKHKVINFDWIGNPWIVYNLFIDYLNLTKEQPVQEQLLTGVL